MKDELRALAAEIRADEQTIAELYAFIAQANVTANAPESAIVTGYYLHNLYMAFEHIFEQVAEAFENHIEDKAQWHAQLLRRMTLDIPAMRPRLISEEAFRCLDELRRFRHVFRSAYSITLDVERLHLVLARALQLKEIYATELAVFHKFLDET
jgi:hypothetical protein